MLEFWTQRLILALHYATLGRFDFDLGDPARGAKRLISELKKFEKREAKLAKKTLGGLFAELKKKEGDWSAVEIVFREVLDARNHLIHEFFLKRQDLLVRRQLTTLRDEANVLAVTIERGMKAVKVAALKVSETFGIGEDVLERKRKELLGKGSQ